AGVDLVDRLRSVDLREREGRRENGEQNPGAAHRGSDPARSRAGGKGKSMGRNGDELERLVEIMARLRAEGGCPWDREQDLRSLRPYLIEEAYEVLDEMDRVGYSGSAKGSWKALCEELGDL